MSLRNQIKLKVIFIILSKIQTYEVVQLPVYGHILLLFMIKYIWVTTSQLYSIVHVQIYYDYLLTNHIILFVFKYIMITSSQPSYIVHVQIYYKYLFTAIFYCSCSNQFSVVIDQLLPPICLSVCSSVSFSVSQSGMPVIFILYAGMKYYKE